MNRSSVAPLVGSVLAERYELVRHLARGGMGDVYEGRDLLLQRPVAIKVFRASAPTDRQRFDAEVTTLAALNHPGLVQVYDAGEHHGDGFVVLELVPGPNLRELLADRGPLAHTQAAVLGEALAEALACIHERGVVHRDITPSNVLCGADGRPRLTDFGIVRLLDTTRVTAAATTMGTARYMAPEQVEGRDVRPAADVYALGLVLLEALTGRPGFEGHGHEVAVTRLLRDPDVAAAPPAWQPLLREMTARDPAARPTSLEVAACLRDLASTPAGSEPHAVVVGPPRVPGSGGAPDAVDPEAVTRAVPVVDGTAVMPAALRPVEPDRADRAPARASLVAGLRSRRALWSALVALAVAALVGLAAADGGLEVPTPPTSTTTPVAVSTPPATAATTVVSEPSAGRRDGRGNKGKGHRDDD